MIEKYVCDKETTHKQEFEHQGFECLVVRRKLGNIRHYYCGYVALPKTKEVEKFFKQDLYDIETNFPEGDHADVGITYHKVLKDYVIVGFDRCHSGSDKYQSLYKTIEMTRAWVCRIIDEFNFAGVDMILDKLKYKRRIADEFSHIKNNKSKQEKVNHPSHYNQGGIECIEAIKASMSKEAYEGFLKGNFLKYVWRFEEKNGVEDLKKAKWYLKRLIEEKK